jgi:hypothetical protein
MLRAYLDGDAWFNTQCSAAADRPVGVRRPP